MNERKQSKVVRRLPKKKPRKHVWKTNTKINHRNVALFRKWTTDQGKIVPRRSSKVTAKTQRRVSTYIKRARIMALLAFVSNET